LIGFAPVFSVVSMVFSDGERWEFLTAQTRRTSMPKCSAFARQVAEGNGVDGALVVHWN
jgi:hypothetical protein